ncbi:hypothetical protein GCM10009304_03950 [Pseudomonas matsuisoli]|uniref:Uncharacterized protein n=1 Tax=Pseudomonas matsuisoli TaxID=1515666 RepID=A0A917PJE8_9PSED|nr:hypothetical protein GCM10009304_03950 [Pseudomonas matsuisoli]
MELDRGPAARPQACKNEANCATMRTGAGPAALSRRSATIQRVHENVFLRE